MKKYHLIFSLFNCINHFELDTYQEIEDAIQDTSELTHNLKYLVIENGENCTNQFDDWRESNE